MTTPDGTAGIADIPSDADIAICGAGPVGLALAALLVKRGMAPTRIAVLDAKPLALAVNDPRSIALSYGSSQILQDIGAWPIDASTIREIHVSRRGHFGRTLIDCREHGLPALGYVTRYGTLVEALERACTAAGIQSRRPASVAALTQDEHHVRLLLSAGESLVANFVVQAEGGLFGEQTGRAHTRDYQQTAIVAHVATSAPLPHRAFERFTDEGPLALLPQSGAMGASASASAYASFYASASASASATAPAPSSPSAYSTARIGAASGPASTHYALVWCVRPATAHRLMALPDRAFLAALENAFGSRVGRFLHVTPRSTYSLGLNAEAMATGRTVAIGNAAQTLHPVAGQGLNLGLRDAAVLARLLARDASPASLQRFMAERQPDRTLTIRLTDVMARIFASAPDGAFSQTLLGLSLGIVDSIRPARRLLAEQMMFGKR